MLNLCLGKATTPTGKDIASTKIVTARLSAVINSAPTSCVELLSKQIRPGRTNDSNEVRKLQEFLNKYENSQLQITGIYDQATQNAVIAFQEKYTEDILKPWNLTRGTANVLSTTLRKINQLACE